MNEKLRTLASGCALSALLMGLPIQAQEVPPPPPRDLKSDIRGGRPFDPDQTREATAPEPIKMPPPLRADPKAPTKPVTVVEAVGISWELQPDVLVARAKLLQATGDTQQQRASLMPTLKISEQYNHSSTLVASLTPGVPASPLLSLILGPTTTDTWSHNATMNLLIFDFFHTRDLVKQSDMRQQAAAAGTVQSQNDVAYHVKQKFYTLLQKERLLKVAENDLSNRQEQLRMARALYRAGNRSPGDVVRAQTSVSNTVYSLNNARRDVELARKDLAENMGLPPLTPLTLVEQDEPDLKDKDVARLLTKAQAQRPDILVAQRNVEAAEAGLRAARTTNWPSISTQAGVTYQGMSNDQLYPTFTLQLACNFQLYDGGVRAGSVKSALGVLANSEAELKRTQLSAESDVVASALGVVTAERNLEAARSAVDSAVEGVRIARGRYQVALGSVTDVFDSQSALVSAQQNLVNAQAELSLARAGLRHAMAEPFDEGEAGKAPSNSKQESKRKEGE